MSYQDPKNTCKVIRMLKPADHGASAPTTANVSVDTKGFEWARIDVQVGTITGTKIEWTVQESSDDGSADAFADVTGAVGTDIATTNDDVVHSIVIKTSKVERYLKIAWTYTSVTVSPLAATCTLYAAQDSKYLGTEVDAIVA